MSDQQLLQKRVDRLESAIESVCELIAKVAPDHPELDGRIMHIHYILDGREPSVE